MKQRGFTLMELMVTMTVAALIFSVVLDVWHVSSVNQKHLLTKTQSFANTTSVLDIIEREARQAIRFEIKTSTSGKSLYTFVMPANRDANNNFTPVRTGNGLVYQEGQQVQYYLSNTTGSPTANGNILWRATAPAGSAVFTPDTTWSMRNTTQPRYPTLQTPFRLMMRGERKLPLMPEQPSLRERVPLHIRGAKWYRWSTITECRLSFPWIRGRHFTAPTLIPMLSRLWCLIW
jgi:prepilin-type N-terminal cleavage/methylation domain-containing protein